MLHPRRPALRDLSFAATTGLSRASRSIFSSDISPVPIGPGKAFTTHDRMISSFSAGYADGPTIVATADCWPCGPGTLSTSTKRTSVLETLQTFQASRATNPDWTIWYVDAEGETFTLWQPLTPRPGFSADGKRRWPSATSAPSPSGCRSGQPGWKATDLTQQRFGAAGYQSVIDDRTGLVHLPTALFNRWPLQLARKLHARCRLVGQLDNPVSPTSSALRWTRPSRLGTSHCP